MDEDIALDEDIAMEDNPGEVCRLPEHEGEAELAKHFLYLGDFTPSEEDVKEANKEIKAIRRLHKKRIASVRVWLRDHPLALKEEEEKVVAPEPEKERDTKPPAVTRALQALGYSPEEINAMSIGDVEEALKPLPESPAKTPPVPVVCSPNEDGSWRAEKQEPPVMTPPVLMTHPVLQVYVNCYRSDGIGESLDVIMAPYADTIAKQQGVDHFDLLDYGKGRKMAAGMLAKALAEKGVPSLFPSGIVLVSTRSLHFDHCFPLLEAITGTVLVRGSRG